MHVDHDRVGWSDAFSHHPSGNLPFALMRSFLLDYTRTLVEAIGADFRDNWDRDRFGPEPAPPSGVGAAMRRFLAKGGVISAGAARQTVAAGLNFVEPHLGNLEWIHAALADEQSKEILVQLVAFRALGHRKVKLPTNTPEFWKVRQQGNQIPHGDEELDAEFLGRKLHQRSLASFGYPIQMFSGPGACYTTFVHEQYRCKTSKGPIECAAGDIAIDAGGCYGDTALYFAHKVGPSGKVASFEFLPVNLSVFRRNLELNPDLASRIRLYENPVYSDSGQKLFVIGNGPGTRVVPESLDPNASKVETLKIDDLVSRGDFPRIDFIKMDIEGAELEALKGSESTLRRFKPKLAITVYHDFQDLWTIPQFLDGCGLRYQFYLRHFTIHAEETVLFASTHNDEHDRA